MNSLEEIRERDADSVETWFREPAIGYAGPAFIDRRWLLAEVDRLRDTLSLAEEGLANYEEEVQARMKLMTNKDAEIARLKEGLARIKELSDGKSIAWTLAYEALNDRPYSHPACSGEPQSGEHA